MYSTSYKTNLQIIIKYFDSNAWRHVHVPSCSSTPNTDNSLATEKGGYDNISVIQLLK